MTFDPLAYLNGKFIPASQLAISVDDLGVVQGVSISERLRTFNHMLFRLDEHLERLENSLQIVELRPRLTIQDIGRLAQELVERNSGLIETGDDFGASLFVTPGLATRGPATVGIHVYPLLFGQWVTYFSQGQALAETGVRQVPSSCWPVELKCRSRMHYFLADKRAHQRFPGSRAILLDQEGFVSEVSTANIVAYFKDTGILSPPRKRILPGVSLSVLADLADRIGLAFHYRDMRLEDLHQADEILLCSTTPCVWPVTQLDGQSVGRGVDGPVFQQLLGAWSESVGVDIVAQARRFADRKQ